MYLIPEMPFCCLSKRITFLCGMQVTICTQNINRHLDNKQLNLREWHGCLDVKSSLCTEICATSEINVWCKFGAKYWERVDKERPLVEVIPGVQRGGAGSSDNCSGMRVRELQLNVNCIHVCTHLFDWREAQRNAKGYAKLKDTRWVHETAAVLGSTTAAERERNRL